MPLGSGILGELLLFGGHGGRLDYRHPALGNSLLPSHGILEMVIGPLEFRLAGSGNLQAVVEFHYVLMRAATEGDSAKQQG